MLGKDCPCQSGGGCDGCGLGPMQEQLYCSDCGMNIVAKHGSCKPCDKWKGGLFNSKPKCCQEADKGRKTELKPELKQAASSPNSQGGGPVTDAERQEVMNRFCELGGKVMNRFCELGGFVEELSV